MTAFADAVQRLEQARADHLTACAVVTVAETRHGVDSAEAEDAVNGPQAATGDALRQAEEALALIPATNAQEAFQKAHLLMGDSMGDVVAKAVKADLARCVEEQPKPDETVAQASHEALKSIRSIGTNFNDLRGPVASLTAMMEILNQLATSSSFESDAGNLRLNEAMHWLANQGLGELRKLEDTGKKIRQLAEPPA